MSQPVFSEREVNDWYGFCAYALGADTLEWKWRLARQRFVPSSDVGFEADDETDARTWGQTALAMTGCM